MFIFDQLKRGERQLQWLAVGVLCGMAILICGLWWLQIVSTKQYSESQTKQMLRKVRVPAVRGKIFDRNGTILVDNRPQYNVNVYFEELFQQSRFFYTNSVVPEFTNKNPGVKLSGSIKGRLVLEARYRAVSNLTFRVSSAFNAPRILSQPAFLRHHTNYPYVPFPILQNLTPQQVAIFSEQFSALPGMDLEAKPVRTNQFGSTAAHLLGYVRETKEIRDDEEDIHFNYSLADYVGQLGAESAFDAQLRGKAGVKTVLVNSTQYRQREQMSVPTAPGQNVWLTIDVQLQQATEKALASAVPFMTVRGAAIVMDVTNGDILAMASAPTFDPNVFVTGGIPAAQWAWLNDPHFTPVFNRATFGSYTPGSIMKIVTAIACLETGLDPKEIFENPGEWRARDGTIIDDTAAPGKYDFVRAFKKSSNTYFIHHGLKAGLPKLVEVGKRFHIGEKTGIPTRQEASGDFLRYDPERNPDAVTRWPQGNIANLCIGQEMTTTPLQMACMTAAIANGGKLFWPRIVSHTEIAAGMEGRTLLYKEGRLRDNIKVHPNHLEWIRHAMLADVETLDGEEGTGHPAYIPGFKIAGKTGTAEVIKQDPKTRRPVKDKDVWFVSYAPHESPRYAVVVMVESGSSGGKTCAPVARKIYEAILKREGETPGLATLPDATLNFTKAN